LSGRQFFYVVIVGEGFKALHGARPAVSVEIAVCFLICLRREEKERWVTPDSLRFAQCFAAVSFIGAINLSNGHVVRGCAVGELFPGGREGLAMGTPGGVIFDKNWGVAPIGNNLVEGVVYNVDRGGCPHRSSCDQTRPDHL
jgi:hypothetical protein